MAYGKRFVVYPTKWWRSKIVVDAKYYLLADGAYTFYVNNLTSLDREQIATFKYDEVVCILRIDKV